MVIQYKCPNCGADMIYNAENGMLHCDSCGTDEHIDSMKDSLQPDEQESFNEFSTETSTNTFETENTAQYQCKNCGAILITDTNTTASSCTFCDAPMILEDRLTGELAPSKVVPFSITKTQAEEAFRKWCGKGLLQPNDFKKANRVKNITGIYIPFWLYEMQSQGDVHAECTKVKHRTEGDYNITETSYYDVYRNVDLYFEKIPVDASKRMDDETMDKLEPFDYSNLKDFHTPYLSGYLAEKYDYTAEDLLPRISKRTKEYTMDYIYSTINGYSSTNIKHKNNTTLQKNAYYTLLPLWSFCYDYENSEHNFIMNGQTGKIVGKPPISTPKSIICFSGISVIIFLIIKIIAYIIGGVWI